MAARLFSGKLQVVDVVEDYRLGLFRVALVSLRLLDKEGSNLVNRAFSQ